MAPVVLPDDVIDDILARLPAKSAVRCRSLSRAWAAKLSSDHFVDRHLHLANRHGAPRILILQDPLDPNDERPPKVHAWSPDHPDGGMTLMELPRALTRRYCCPLSFIRYFGRAMDGKDHSLAPRLATQQCRGLVVLEATGARVHYVFNPSTSQTAALPEGRYTGRRSLRVKEEEDPDGHQKYASVGIGYDARTRRHKVVRVYYRGRDTKKKPPGCEVYVVNGSTGLWRPADGGAGALEKPAGWVDQNETSVFAQGHVHWLAKRNLDSPPQELFIVSFSIGDEKFGTVPPPLAMDDGNNCLLRHKLTELGGRLCLFSSLFSTERSKQIGMWPNRYYVWLLRDHETGTWDLHCRIDLDTLPPEVAHFMRYGDAVHGISPLAIVDNGRRIVLLQPRACLWYAASFRMRTYAPATGATEELLDRSGLVANKKMVLTHATLYEESVVSPGQPCEDIIFAMSLVLRKLSMYTLARLMCVCRSWRAMIESDDFCRTRITMSPFGFIF